MFYCQYSRRRGMKVRWMMPCPIGVAMVSPRRQRLVVCTFWNRSTQYVGVKYKWSCLIYSCYSSFSHHYFFRMNASVPPIMDSFAKGMIVRVATACHSSPRNVSDVHASPVMTGGSAKERCRHSARKAKKARRAKKARSPHLTMTRYQNIGLDFSLMVHGGLLFSEIWQWYWHIKK